MSSSIKWTTHAIPSLPLGFVTFDPFNEIIATCIGSDCVLFSVSDGKRVGVCENNDEIVSLSFTEQNRLLMFGKCGEITEWLLTEDGPIRDSSRKITDFTVIRAFYLPDDTRSVLITDRGEQYSAEYLMQDGTLVHIAKLPAGLSNQQITVANKYIAYCLGKEVSVIYTEEDASMSISNYVCKKHIEGLGIRNSANVFERITCQGDTLAATLTIGIVYIWSHVSQKGIHDSAYTIHWHKVAPCIALTQFDGLLSAGAEAVLCKFTLSGAGRPSMLPRLAAPVRDIAISADASHLAVVLEDNSLHVVLTSSMTVLSSMQTIVTCERSLATVFTTDPCLPGTLVMNGKPGSLQWIKCTDSYTLRQVSFSLENVADGDMSFAGIIQAFPDVEQVFLSKAVIVTLERIINFEEDHKRLRFWERSNDDGLIVKLSDSFVVSKDTISISGCKDPTSVDEKIFISIMSNGKVDVWITCEDEKRFKLDVVRRIDRHYPFHCGSIIHGRMWAAAYSGGADHTDVVVIWDTAQMEELDVLRTDGRAHTLEFDGKSFLICATDKAVRCWRHVAMRFDLLWVLEQSLGVHLSPLGSFAWSENTVMEFDIESASLKGSFKFPDPVSNILAVSDENCQLLVVAKTIKGLFLAYPKSHKKRLKAMNQATKTPFSSLAPVETTAEITSSRTAMRQIDKKAALHLFDGPCHALPPISHLAPLFIAQCLAPPLQENK